LNLRRLQLPILNSELLELGLEIAQSTVADSVAKNGQKDFFRHRAAVSAAVDMFVVPIIGFKRWAL
jgi:hypothetical protein